jgi:hypothetical protein
MKKMNYINYFHSESEMSFELLELHISDTVDLLELFNLYPRDLFLNCLENICLALDYDLEKIPVALIPEADLVVEIEKNQYFEISKNALTYFEELEDYETCNLIKKIQKLIKENQK